MIRKFVVLLLAAWFTGAIAPGCGQSNSRHETASQEAETEEPAGENGMYVIRLDGVPLQVEIAQDEETRSQGLMYREELPEDQGMLFVFSEQRVLSFWMRNTFIPLDIAFIDSEGKIVDIQRMEPLDESKLYVSAAPAQYALEVNAGWFERHGVKVGSRVEF